MNAPVRGASPRFVVAWEMPPALAPSDRVLTFLSPAEERTVTQAVDCSVTSARALAHEVRAEARDLFIRLCVGIGTVADADGRTFRQALAPRGDSSDWWFHRLSWKVAATHDRQTLEWIATTLVIDRWATSQGARELHCHGASSLLVRVLRRKYAVVEHGTRRPGWRVAAWPLEALIERVWALTWLYSSRRRAPKVPPADDSRPVAVITGHPWLRWDGDQQRFIDPHFAGVAEALDVAGFRVVRYLWLLATDRGIQPPHRAAAALARGEAIAVQSCLRRREILTEILSVRGLRRCLRWSRRREFRELFAVEGLDLFPYFRVPLFSGFAGAQIPLARLGAIGTARAVATQRPVLSLCHFEFFAEGRAHYEGVRRAGVPVLTATMQHGANTQVAFYCVDGKTEVLGQPDGCAAPHAAQVFVMGDDGRDCFLTAGYPPSSIWLTGTTRVNVAMLREEVRRRRKRARAPGALRLIVLVSSLSRDAELIEAACIAADDLPDVEVWVRQKPGTRSSLKASTRNMTARIHFTEGTLADDLSRADVVLFSASTAAEQAFACGVPTWQWLPLNITGASLADMVSIPQFHSVADLQSALRALQQEPAAFTPDPAAVDALVTRVFGPGDGGEATRIVTRLLALAPGAARAASDGTGTRSRDLVESR